MCPTALVTGNRPVPRAVTLSAPWRKPPARHSRGRLFLTRPVALAPPSWTQRARKRKERPSARFPGRRTGLLGNPKSSFSPSFSRQDWERCKKHRNGAAKAKAFLFQGKKELGGGGSFSSAPAHPGLGRSGVLHPRPPPPQSPPAAPFSACTGVEQAARLRSPLLFSFPRRK